MTEKQADEIINLLKQINIKLDEMSDEARRGRRNTSESLDDIKCIVKAIKD